MGSHSFLQGIFPTQGSKLGLLHCRWILYHLSHQGSPKQLSSWWKLMSTSGPSCLWLNFHIVSDVTSLFNMENGRENWGDYVGNLSKTKNSQILRSKRNWRFELCRKSEFSILLCQEYKALFKWSLLNRDFQILCLEPKTNSLFSI